MVEALRRCPWSGFASFQAYAFGSVLAANLLQLARPTMSRVRAVSAWQFRIVRQDVNASHHDVT